MNHLKELQEQKLSELKLAINKVTLQEYYLTHTYKETYQYYKDTYGCSIKNFRLLLNYFNIERKGKGYNLSHDRDSIKQGMINKYGTDNAQKVTEIKERTKQTCLEKYGVDNVAKAEEVQNKIKQTNLYRYGVENVYQAEEVKEKIKQTCMDRYGVVYTSQAEQTKINCKRTKAERYGDPGYHNYEKMIQTNLEKYGEPFFTNIEKRKQTCLEKYGVEHASQCREVHVKMANNRKKNSVASDSTKFDSSWEVLVYEYALQKGYKIETQIPIEYNDVQITFIDFKINGQLYEVKGAHLLNNCWQEKGITIDSKLRCYKENNIIIITDLAQLTFIDPELTYIDIHSLSF